MKVAAADRTVLATMEERFAIRGRTGAAELTDPVRAGGAVSENATDTPRRRRRDVTLTAPVDMRPFAVVSGDHNPIHTDRSAALLAGLESPIVHGMWLSAAAQHVVTHDDGRFVARVDLAYADKRIAIEYDSFEHHTGKVALVRDSTRRNALAAAGWTVLSATAADLRSGCRQLARDAQRLLSSQVAS